MELRELVYGNHGKMSNLFILLTKKVEIKFLFCQMKKNINHSKLFLIRLINFTLLILILTSCQEKDGKDKYPEIPEFPITTNEKIKFKKIFNNPSNLFYNNSDIISFSNDSIIIYDITKKTSLILNGYYDSYKSPSFLCHNDKEKYFVINDTNYEKRSIDSYDEYPRYNAITDSLLKKSAKPNPKVNEKELDSMFIKYFYNKHKITTIYFPYTQDLGNSNYLIINKNKTFVLKNTPHCLAVIFDNKKEKYLNLPQNKEIFKVLKFNHQPESYFKLYDYSMMHKFWTSSGGGNHYIPSIPYMTETGYNYFKFDLNKNIGKFKILSNKEYFEDLTEISNNRFITSFNNSIYEVTFNGF